MERPVIGAQRGADIACLAALHTRCPPSVSQQGTATSTHPCSRSRPTAKATSCSPAPPDIPSGDLAAVRGRNLASLATLSRASGRVQVRLSTLRDTVHSGSRIAIERDTVMVRDPVCKMQISETDAQAVRRADGASFYFCSAACVQQFDAEPQRYYPPSGGTSTSQTAPMSMAARQGRVPASVAAGAALLRPITFGLLAVLGLLVFYLGIITLAQGWGHAVQQLADDRWFIGAITLGFGTQIGLYTYLSGLHAQLAVGGVAASTGTSTTAMLACCAHHLADVLPLIGLSGAAVFLNAYKTPLLWLGIVMNLAGVVYLLWKVRQQRQIARLTPLAT